MLSNSLIPKPSKVKTIGGKFKLSSKSKIISKTKESSDIATLLAEYLRPATGFELAVVSNSCPVSGDIVLDESGNDMQDDAGFVSEKHQINVSSGILNLQSQNTTGLARAIQTVRQLFPAEIFSKTLEHGIDWSFDAVEIKDDAAFRWRGMLLDVGRYFFSVEDVCHLIDLFALHKYNIFHLHLTEDQGWRIEIKRYPRLTEVGSKREYTIQGCHDDSPRKYDNKPHCGFYTQEDIKRIVEFAGRRHITIIPEIDMPGHMQAAIAAYPELGNNPEFQYKTRCTWGISKHILNPRDSTVEFMKNILAEVIDLFPSRFIHIGGDEAPKEEWELSREAQELMVQRGLKDENEMQSWFIGQIASYINSRGRRLIGWNEIMDGGLPEGASIMSWHNERGAIEAASLKHDAVMADCKYTYFDYYQANPEYEPLAMGAELPCEMVYRFNPVPSTLPSEQKKYILGAQGSLWTEYMSNLKHVEYMAFPRSCALAERLWANNSSKDFVDFCERLSLHRMRLTMLNVNVHKLP